MPPWQNAQRPMAITSRWGSFDYNQSLIAHANSVPLVMQYVINEADLHGLDTWILLVTTQVHDHGEPLTGGDEDYFNQTPDKPIQEWMEFARMIADAPEATRQNWLQAFTLPYVRKDCRHRLPAAGKAIAEKLVETHWLEATVFDFVERLDYLFSALEGHKQGAVVTATGNNGSSVQIGDPMLQTVLDVQAPRLDALCEEYPRLRAVWTAKLSNELHRLAA